MGIETFKDLVKSTVEYIRIVDVGSLAGYDSENELPDAWEAWKFELQMEQSILFDHFAALIRDICLEKVQKLTSEEIKACWMDMKRIKDCAVMVDEKQMAKQLEKTLLERINNKAQKERIVYNDLGFKYYYQYGPGFVVYGEVIRRKSYRTMFVKAASVATGRSGEMAKGWAGPPTAMSSETRF